MSHHPQPKPKHARAIGPGLRGLLLIVLGLVAVLSANSIYLAAITFLEWLQRAERINYQNCFFQLMFLAHLVLGLPLKASADFGADFFNPTNTHTRYIHDHLFPGANTGTAHLRNEPDIVRVHQDFLKDCARVDIFGVKEGGTVDGLLLAPIRPVVPPLKPGRRYLLEAVIRTLTLGHPLTQGTTDSNELWAEVRVSDSQGKVLGRSGGLGPYQEVDPWSHFLNTYLPGPERNSDRPTEPAGYSHPALRSPGHAGRRGRRPLCLHHPARPDGPCHGRTQAQLPEIRHNLPELRIRPGVHKRKPLSDHQQPPDHGHRFR